MTDAERPVVRRAPRKRKPWTAADLRAWRDRLGLSQPQAAERIGISVATIRDYEQGRYYADGLPGYLARLCRYVERYGPLD